MRSEGSSDRQTNRCNTSLAQGCRNLGGGTIAPPNFGKNKSNSSSFKRAKALDYYLPLKISRHSCGSVAGFLRNNVGLMNDPARYEIAFSLIFSKIYLVNAGVESYIPLYFFAFF